MTVSRDTHYPHDWYWRFTNEAGADPEGHVFSSDRSLIVTVADAAYIAWVADGGVAKSIASVAELAVVLRPYRRGVNATATALLQSLAAYDSDVSALMWLVYGLIEMLRVRRMLTSAEKSNLLAISGQVSPSEVLGVQLTSNNILPGTVQLYAGATVGSGWLECNGAAVSRTTYADLFTAIGTTWGAGDGSTTFNLPDLRGRAPIGVGTGTGLTARALAAVGGTETHVLSAAEMPAHSHAFSDPNFTFLGYKGTGGTFDSTGGAEGLAIPVRTANEGGGGAHANMQPWVALRYVIKT